MVNYSGDESIDAEEFYPGDPDGEPFVIQVSEPGHIPVSIVIFAKDEEDARARFEKALAFIEKHGNISREKQEEFYKKHGREYESVSLGRLRMVKRIIAKHGMRIEKLDKRLIVKAPWSSNDNIV
jgi:hypothetical protein